jgi:hypothetical protein
VADPLATAPPASVAAATLDRYVGLYRLGPGWYVRIRRDGAELTAQATREAESPMAARSDTSFWVAAYNAPVVFAVRGKAVELGYRGRRHPRLEESAPLAPADLARFAGAYYSEELDASYRVEVKDGGLVLRHRRHGVIELTRLWGDDFGGSIGLRSIEFRRGPAGEVSGFAVFIDERSRDVRFVKGGSR